MKDFIALKGGLTVFVAMPPPVLPAGGDQSENGRQTPWA